MRTAFNVLSTVLSVILLALGLLIVMSGATEMTMAEDYAALIAALCLFAIAGITPLLGLAALFTIATPSREENASHRLLGVIPAIISALGFLVALRGLEWI